MKNYFRNLSLLLVFTLLFSFVASVSYAQNNLTEEEFLTELKTVGDGASFIKIIGENASFVDELLTYDKYYAYDSTIQQETARLFILNKTEYAELKDFQNDFEICILLARVNTASNYMIIHETIQNYNEYLGLDLSLYNSLRNKGEVAIQLLKGCAQFVSLNDFKTKFDSVVVNLKRMEVSQQSPSTPSSPSVGCSRAFECSIFLSDGTPLDALPENKTKVKLVIETSVMQLNTVFVVAVYDNDNTLKTVKTFDITATDADSLETLELITEYDSSGIIKLFNVYDMSGLKPVAQSLLGSFGECVLGK